MKINSIILSWDFFLALTLSIFVFCILPDQKSISLATSVYGVGISVLSIVFSIFFAALAIIISSGDNEFIQFLELEKNIYTNIIATFIFTIGTLFGALLLSLALYFYTNTFPDEAVAFQSKLIPIFIFFFLYSLLAAAISIFDSIRYAEYRTKFIQKLEKRKIQSS